MSKKKVTVPQLQDVRDKLFLIALAVEERREAAEAASAAHQKVLADRENELAAWQMLAGELEKLSWKAELMAAYLPEDLGEVGRLIELGQQDASVRLGQAEAARDLDPLFVFNQAISKHLAEEKAAEEARIAAVAAARAAAKAKAEAERIRGLDIAAVGAEAKEALIGAVIGQCRKASGHTRGDGWKPSAKAFHKAFADLAGPWIEKHYGVTNSDFIAACVRAGDPVRTVRRMSGARPVSGSPDGDMLAKLEAENEMLRSASLAGVEIVSMEDAGFVQTSKYASD